MIGSGILLLLLLARDIGSAAWLLIIWLVTGDYRAALSYGELAGMMPGRRSICLHSACIRKISVVLWLDCFTVIQTGVIAAVTFANYSAIFFPVDTTLFD
jgi:APA family basic amino acid/polyamine antiporter